MKYLYVLFLAFISASAQAQLDEREVVEPALPNITVNDELVIKNPPKEASGYTEYFLLYEARNLRKDLEETKRDLYQEFADRELSMMDRASSYTVNTMTYFFYLITIGAALLALSGWRTIRDLKNSANEKVQEQIDRMLLGFQDRMHKIEADLTKKGEEILQQQEELERLQQLNSLWVQANRERDDAKKLDILEEIRELDPENSDAMIMKSNTYIRLEMFAQALELANQVLEVDTDSSSAYYAKARALAQMGEENIEEAIESLRNAFNLSSAWREYKGLEEDFEPLKKNKEFKSLLAEWA